MNDEEVLNCIIQQKATGEPSQQRCRSIGVIFEEYKKGLRKCKRQGSVVELLFRLLPRELGKHCRAVSFLRGVLKVEVEAGTYMFEMQSLRSQLLGQLQLNCPGAKVDSIRLVACETLKEKPRQERQKTVKV
ncbi:MAG: DUF721 domain-containing protein [Planctomycetes bacterium]|nr:DUF721 domain-containing protein [Planctomycetota bacterium]